MKLYKCSSSWYFDRDTRLIKDYRELGLVQAAERARLSIYHARTILRFHGVEVK